MSTMYKLYKSAKYVKRHDMDGNPTNEIGMIEAVKKSDNCCDYIVNQEGNEYYAELEKAHNDSDIAFTIADAD